jgi:hypothetical protein
VPNNYFDNTVTNGVEYFYGITAVDDSGNESAMSAIASATPEGDTTPPAQITDLAVVDFYDEVDLSWSAVAAADLDYYRIYRDVVLKLGGSPLVDASDLFDTIPGGTETYKDTAASTDADSTYFYRVAAVDSSGNVATLSNVVSATPELEPLAFASFSMTTPTIADTTAARDAEPDMVITTNRASYLRALFWEYGDTEPDTTGMAWRSPTATTWSDTFDANIPVPVATSDTSVTVSWTDVTGETSYLLERSVSGAAYTTVNEPAADATSYVDAAAPRGELMYRLRAINSAGPDTSAVALLDSFFHNEAVRVYGKAYALEDWGETPIASSEVSGLWTSEEFVPADTTPPDTTGVFAGVAVDTTNTSDVLLTLNDMTITGDPSQVEFQWSNDGGTVYYGDSSWSPGTASTTVGDTIHTGIATGAINGDLYTRFRLRDDEGTPNVSEWNVNAQEYVRAGGSAVEDTVGSGIAGTSTSALGSLAYAAKITMPEDGDINSATLYCVGAADRDVKVGLFDASLNLLASGELLSATSESPAWVEIDFDSSYSASESTEYWVMFYASGSSEIYYSSEVSAQRLSRSDVAYVDWPPSSLSAGAPATGRRYSIYVTYTH